MYFKLEIYESLSLTHFILPFYVKNRPMFDSDQIISKCIPMKTCSIKPTTNQSIRVKQINRVNGLFKLSNRSMLNTLINRDPIPHTVTTLQLTQYM